jgi:hypothetical protein
MRRGFTHPFSPLFTPSEGWEWDRIRWYLEIEMILSATGFGAFGPFQHSSFLSQVTTGYDPMFIPRVLSAFANGMN